MSSGHFQRYRPHLRVPYILLTFSAVFSVVALYFDAKSATESVFVSYAYNEASRLSAPKNLLYFLRNGVSESPFAHVDYGIVVNGDCSFRSCLTPQEFSRIGRNHVYLWRRENTGFDFGAHLHALSCLNSLGRTYDYYLFLNSGVVGPFYPSYMPKVWHWSMAFTERLSKGVGIASTSVVCLSPLDLGGYGPRIEGFAFGMTRLALESELRHGTSFRVHGDKKSAILRGEYALTDAALQGGFLLGTILDSYDNVNWESERSWLCNNITHPTRASSYFGTSLDPFEVLFHKVEWGSAHGRSADAVENLGVSPRETALRTDWKL